MMPIYPIYWLLLQNKMTELSRVFRTVCAEQQSINLQATVDRHSEEIPCVYMAPSIFRRLDIIEGQEILICNSSSQENHTAVYAIPDSTIDQQQIKISPEISSQLALPKYGSVIIKILEESDDGLPLNYSSLFFRNYLKNQRNPNCSNYQWNECEEDNRCYQWRRIGDLFITGFYIDGGWVVQATNKNGDVYEYPARQEGESCLQDLLSSRKLQKNQRQFDFVTFFGCNQKTCNIKSESVGENIRLSNQIQEIVLSRNFHNHDFTTTFLLKKIQAIETALFQIKSIGKPYKMRKTQNRSFEDMIMGGNLDPNKNFTQLDEEFHLLPAQSCHKEQNDKIFSQNPEDPHQFSQCKKKIQQAVESLEQKINNLELTFQKRIIELWRNAEQQKQALSNKNSAFENQLMEKIVYVNNVERALLQKQVDQFKVEIERIQHNLTTKVKVALQKRDEEITAIAGCIHRSCNLRDMVKIKEKTIQNVPVADSSCSTAHCFMVDGHTITKGVKGGGLWTQLLMSNKISRQIKTAFTLKILKSKSNFVMFGLTSCQYLSESSSWTSPKNVVLLAWNGTSYASGEITSSHCEQTAKILTPPNSEKGFKTGQSINMQVDLINGRICWKVNGQIREDLFYSQLCDPTIDWVPYIEMFTPGDVVQWVQYEDL